MTSFYWVLASAFFIKCPYFLLLIIALCITNWICKNAFYLCWPGTGLSGLYSRTLRARALSVVYRWHSYWKLYPLFIWNRVIYTYWLGYILGFLGCCHIFHPNHLTFESERCAINYTGTPDINKHNTNHIKMYPHRSDCICEI